MIVWKIFVALLVPVFLIPNSVLAQDSGTTLTASQTLDICQRTDRQWLFSGTISVWNTGMANTNGFRIFDHVQSKSKDAGWKDHYSQWLGMGDVIPAGSVQTKAVVYNYSFVGAPLSGEIRNVADVQIVNYAGAEGAYLGPSPMAAFTAANPSSCALASGCVYSTWYWASKPGVNWPAPYTRDLIFFNSLQMARDVLTVKANGNGYFMLASEFIAAQLNIQENLNRQKGYRPPAGIQQVIKDATAWLQVIGNTPNTCSSPSACGVQKTWAGILEAFNTGVYPAGPARCGNEAY